MEKDPEILNTKDLMDKLGVCRPTVIKWVKQGMPVIKKGYVVRFQYARVIEWLANPNPTRSVE